MKRAVITGMGAITPLGANLGDFWNGIKDNKIGFSFIDNFETERTGVKIAGFSRDFDETQYCDKEKYFDKKESKRLDRFTKFAVVASNEALCDAGSNFSDVDPFRAGVIIGCGIGGIELTLNEHEKFMEKGPTRISAFYIPMMISNMAAGTVSMKTGFKGANFATVTACASSTHAVGEAFRKIKDGYLDVCLCGGTESCINEFTIGGFSNIKALSKSDDLTRASIPFDKERNGFVLGEGCGMLLIEELEHAKARGAHIYAEIVGYGATCDGYHMTSPAPDGIAAGVAMTQAFSEAGLAPTDVDYINAHGTSTGLNDKYETQAIKNAFGEHAGKIRINSTKSMTGHLLGAAGAIETIVTAKTIEEGLIHATVGYKVPDEECDLDYCTKGNVKQDVNVGISNSLGFGGHNASVCLKKFSD